MVDPGVQRLGVILVLIRLLVPETGSWKVQLVVRIQSPPGA